MEALGALTDAIARNSAATLAALALLALAWVYREKSKGEQEHRDRERAMYEAALKREQEQNAAHLATALQVRSLAERLADCINLFERVVLPKQTGGGA